MEVLHLIAASSVMIRIIALLPDPIARDRLSASLMIRDRVQHPPPRFCRSWEEVASAVLRSASELLVFDPYAEGRVRLEPAVRFSEAFGSCVMVAYSRFPRGSAREVLELARSGVHAVVTRDIDDSPRALAELLDLATERGTVARMRSIWVRRAPPALQPLLPRILAVAAEDPSPERVGLLLHAHPKTIGAHLRVAGLPSLGKLVIWVRLVLACDILRDAGRSVENVALVLGFASANGFRNQLVRYAALKPTDLRDPDGSERLLQRFRAALVRHAAAGTGS
jgi:AraC-like DNA-binding protein